MIQILGGAQPTVEGGFYAVPPMVGKERRRPLRRQLLIEGLDFSSHVYVLVLMGQSGQTLD